MTPPNLTAPPKRTISPIVYPSIVAAVIALTAHGRWPYGYYENFRWIISASVAYAAYLGRAYPPIVVACILIAVVFNPISPLRTRAYVWQRYDIAAAMIMFSIAGFALVAANRNKTLP